MQEDLEAKVQSRVLELVEEISQESKAVADSVGSGGSVEDFDLLAVRAHRIATAADALVELNKLLED